MARHTRRRLVRLPLQLCLLALTLSLVYEAAVRYAPTALTAPFAAASSLRGELWVVEDFCRGHKSIFCRHRRFQ